MSEPKSLTVEISCYVNSNSDPNIRKIKRLESTALDSPGGHDPSSVTTQFRKREGTSDVSLRSVSPTERSATGAHFLFIFEKV